jgi:glycosyltransferase involved in cell wall biosynthesis
MRIVLDLQGAQSASRFRGIGRYSLSLALAIARQRGRHEIIIALSGLFPETIEPVRAAFEQLLPQENIKVWHAPSPVRACEADNNWRRVAARQIREAFLASLKPDVIHLSSLIEGFIDDAITSIGGATAGIPTIVTLYDVIPLLNPASYLKPNPAYERFYLDKIDELKRADAWLAISDFSAVECCDTLGLEKQRVFPISTACDPVFSQNRRHALDNVLIRQQLQPGKSFVLYSGGADQRKNLPRLIRAYAAVAPELRQAHQLLFAGKMPEASVHDLQSIATKAGLQTGELVFTGYVSDEELAWLYQNCKLFVFPSWHEGFGLPALEAMSCGAPAIGSNKTSLPEVIGWDEALFDPFSEQEITAKLTRALTDDAFRIELVQRGLQQSQNFSWDSTAKRAIAAFETMVPLSKPTQDVACQSSILKKLVSELGSLAGSSAATKQDLIATAWAVAQNHPRLTYKQIFVDISELVQRDARSGVQRVTRSILKELLDNPPAGYRVEPVFATTDVSGYRYARSFTTRITGQVVPVGDDTPLEAQPGDLFLGLDLQHHVVKAQESYLDHLYRSGVRVWFVVYDLLPILLPECFPPGAAEGHVTWLQTITRYSGAICISEAVANELQNWVNTQHLPRMRHYRIDWFHLGADVENSLPVKGLPEDANQVLDLLASRPSFLMVGTIEPRKGYAQALAAFELLWSEGIDINLVIVGKQGWMMGDLAERLRRHPECSRRLFWLEGISDEYLEKVYAASFCLIAASEGEGFGLPLIEAAQHNLPVIARDIPVFREVAGAYASYYHGPEPASLTAAIKKHLASPSSDRPPMAWLTWAESAEQLKQVIGICPLADQLQNKRCENG